RRRAGVTGEESRRPRTQMDRRCRDSGADRDARGTPSSFLPCTAVPGVPGRFDRRCRAEVRVVEMSALIVLHWLFVNRRPAGIMAEDDLPLARGGRCDRSEEHTSELQSRGNLVCRLL